MCHRAVLPGLATFWIPDPPAVWALASSACSQRLPPPALWALFPAPVLCTDPGLEGTANGSPSEKYSSYQHSEGKEQQPGPRSLPLTSYSPAPWPQANHWIREDLDQTALVVQWLGICMPMQGTWVWFLVWEDPTCLTAAKPVHHNYWSCATWSSCSVARQAACNDKPVHHN